jgi:chromosome segregation ATPase
MNLLTAIEQWVDTRAAKQIEIRMADVARMVRNEVKAQLEDSAATLALETREAVDAHNDLESRVDSLEQTLECHDNGIDDLESRLEDLEARVDDVGDRVTDADDHPTHGEVADLVREVISNASISIDL